MYSSTGADLTPAAMTAENRMVASMVCAGGKDDVSVSIPCWTSTEVVLAVYLKY